MTSDRLGIKFTAMLEKNPFVYIMASKRNGTLYTGVTGNLPGRVRQHKNHTFAGFSQKYNTRLLVYFEQCGDMYLAIAREKQIKKWRRKWKLMLIEKDNPEWKDLSEDFI